MKALERIAKSLQSELAALRACLNEQISGMEESIRPWASYCLEPKGKRLRPLIVFLASGTQSQSKSIVQAAAIVELVHVATLVHDDILDEAQLRHSRPTLAQHGSRKTAILLGDALFAHALELAASYPSSWVCKTVARAVRRVCAGEIQQTLENKKNNLERYRRIIGLKTGELFELSAALGAHLSDTPPEQEQALSTFGFHIGVAYQMLDDILDIWGQESTLGKTLGTDAATGKQTLPYLVDIENNNLEIPEKNKRLQASLDLFEQEVEAARTALLTLSDLPTTKATPLLELAQALKEAPNSFLSKSLTSSISLA